jgi:cell division protein DivIC
LCIYKSTAFKVLSKLPGFLKNKYFIALIAVGVWLLFFDKNNLVHQWRLQRQLNELKRDREYYLQEIERDSTAMRLLKDDPEELERYARENYLMKKEGEDIFIIPEE